MRVGAAQDLMVDGLGILPIMQAGGGSRPMFLAIPRQSRGL